MALARAFVTNPRVLFLEEPLSALDKELRIDMQIELKRIQREIGILKDGRMVQAGPPRDVYDRPASALPRSFWARPMSLTAPAKALA